MSEDTNNSTRGNGNWGIEGSQILEKRTFFSKLRVIYSRKRVRTLTISTEQRVHGRDTRVRDVVNSTKSSITDNVTCASEKFCCRSGECIGLILGTWGATRETLASELRNHYIHTKGVVYILDSGDKILSVCAIPMIIKERHPAVGMTIVAGLDKGLNPADGCRIRCDGWTTELRFAE